MKSQIKSFHSGAYRASGFEIFQQTLGLLQGASKFISDVVAQGKSVLFLGTKKQAQETIMQEATRVGAFYIDQRWLGGTFTNITVIQSRIDYLVRLEERKLKGQFQLLPKKEGLKLDEQITSCLLYTSDAADE